ncbi:DUF6884 domain-containing protein [Streptomyces sp. DH8]|uniref:DUF6884 domain-containing protein n=1 Tax=Streptomyces sp. DH8 TaxID=2857008 RepID=UPI001E4E33B0|nr:DUF6884 domain-containing protein [Streptomyces sp. DH8]
MIATPTSPARPARIVVIPCSGAKRDVPAPAGELYLGSYHRACRATADALTRDRGLTLVLSARYGLVPLDQVLEPYEMTFSDRGAVNDLTLQAQARRLGIDTVHDVTVLAGSAYVAAARTVWPHAVAPLAGLGIGKQLQRLRDLRARTEKMRTAQPVEPAFADAPMYDVPSDYQQAARPFTVAVAGPGRTEGDPVELFLIEEYNSARAWAKVLAWYMVENETPDAIVVGSESFDGAPDKAHGFVHDLRGEHARQEALDDLADQAAEQVDAFHESTADLADHSEAYETALAEAAYSAWPLILQVAANDGS